ncbi:MAG: SDR family NAD(P)-dependent oxidoreductase [Acidimicrobiales bacterium]
MLITSSIASTVPGPYQSTYNASRAFVQLFAQALREEMRDTGVTVTALMPGPTDTEVSERGDLDDTLLGKASKDEPRDVARAGLDALFAGKDQVVSGSLLHKVGAAVGKALPQPLTAAVGSRISKPRSG